MEALNKILGISIALFMAGIFQEAGLKLQLRRRERLWLTWSS